MRTANTSASGAGNGPFGAYSARAMRLIPALELALALVIPSASPSPAYSADGASDGVADGVADGTTGWTTGGMAGVRSASGAITPRPNSPLRLPGIFGDHMVMQRGGPVPVWGWASPGAQVELNLYLDNSNPNPEAEAEAQIGRPAPHGDALRERARPRATATATADADGQWFARLPTDALSPSAPEGTHRPAYALAIASGGHLIVFRDILLGDVWLASGQSNMEWQLAQTTGGAEAIAAAHYPNLRVFRPSDREAAISPQTNIRGAWTACAPDTAGRFTGVGFYFARELLDNFPDTPIGLIDTSWSGLPAQSYISIEKLDAIPALRGYAHWYRSDRDAYVPPAAEDIARRAALQAEADIAYARLREITHAIPAEGQGLERPDYDDAAWDIMVLPTLWEQADAGLDHYDGVVWFRRHVALPADWIGRDLEVSLGAIDDQDITFANGVEIGRGNLYNERRVYTVPAAVNTSADLLLAVRVVDTGGGGGLYTGPMTLAPAFRADAESAPGAADGPAALVIDGEWKFSPEPGFAPPPHVGNLPGAVNPWTPTTLFNSWIAPTIPYAVRGAIWYQGESNAGDWRLYRTLFPAMIEDWRERWGNDFLFYWVQLANFMQRSEEPRDTDWAGLREAQTLTLRLPGTGQAVAIDLGEADDIHPGNKADVGRRLAVWAMRDAHGAEAEPSGPLLREVTIDGNVATLRFNHVGGGLVAGRPGRRTRDMPPPAAFALAGEDGVFRWAIAEITAPDTITLAADGVNAPRAVRYAWDDNPTATVYSAEGLPMTPFRWPVPE